MNCRRTLLLIIWIGTITCISDTCVQAADEFHFENDLSVISNSISGPGKSNSALTEGVNYLNLFNMYGDGQVGDVTYNYQMGGKITDDPSYDITRYSLTHFALKAASPRHALALGDTFEFFSPYTLSSALKGGAYKYLGGATPYIPVVTIIYGQAAPRWDSLWGGKETDRIDRNVMGSRFQFNMDFPLRFGLNIIESQDSGATHPSDTLLDNRIYSFDFQYKPSPGLTVAGESAFNDTDARVADNRSSEEIDGYALNLKAIRERESLRLLLEYERVAPDFKNPLGSATPDREKVKIASRYQFDKSIHLYTNFLWYQDNLDNQKTWGQTDTYIPEITFAYIGPFNRPDAHAKLTYMKEIAKRESEQIRNDNVFNVNYKDRLGLIATDTNVGLKLHKTDLNSRIENKEFTFNTNLSSRFATEHLVLSPNLFLGGWSLRDELSTNDDRAYKYAFGLGIDLPVGHLSSNWSLGVNDIKRDAGQDSTRTFGNFSIYWQPRLLMNLRDIVVYMRGAFNEFEFSNETEDFQESTILAGIKIKY